MGSRPEDNKNVTDWTIFVDPDTDEHYYSSKSKKALVHNIPVGIKARYAFPLCRATIYVSQHFGKH